MKQEMEWSHDRWRRDEVFIETWENSEILTKAYQTKLHPPLVRGKTFTVWGMTLLSFHKKFIPLTIRGQTRVIMTQIWKQRSCLESYGTKLFPKGSCLWDLSLFSQHVDFIQGFPILIVCSEGFCTTAFKTSITRKLQYHFVYQR